MTDRRYEQTAYEAYGDSIEWVAFTGIPMLQWRDLPEHVRNAWKAAATAVIDKVNEAHVPYDKTSE